MHVAHDEAGFALAVPADWRVEQDAGDAALFAVEGPRPEGVFAANVNVVVDDASDELEALAQRHLEGIAGALVDYRLIDAEHVEIDGRPAARFLVLHLFRLHSLALEQWLVPAQARTFVLSATCEAVDYDEYRQRFAAMAAAFRVAGEPS